MILNAVRTLRQLRRDQFLSPDELKALQEKRLRSVVTHAYRNVAYYRRLFQETGIEPQDIQTLEDLRKIPITTKKTLQGLPPDQILAAGTNRRRCVVKHTSGSTGMPLQIYLSPEERDYQILLNLRILMENGLRLRDRVVYIINPRRFPNGAHWFQRMGILRRNYLSVFDYAQDHVRALKALKPDVIYGYPSNLTLLASSIKEQGVHGIAPRHVFSVAEALEPRARRMIDSAMNVSTCDILGTIELGDIAWQCEMRGGYHLSADAVLVEFLKDDVPVGPGQEGSTVCTSLVNYVMPLIRYAVNDVCIPSETRCSCGRTLPRVESIQGRANDFILLPDGQVIASCFLVIIMQSVHEVAQYRVLQDTPEEITVQIVKGAGFSGRTEERIRKEVSAATRYALKIRMEFPEELERDSSGKIRTVVSRIVPELGGERAGAHCGRA